MHTLAPAIEMVREILSQLGIIMAVGVLSGVFAQKIKIPDVIVLLLAGILLGRSGFELVNIPFRERLSQTVVSESAFNDALGAIATFIMIGLVLGQNVSASQSVLDFLWQAGAGLVCGLVTGYAAAFLTANPKRHLLADFSPTVVFVAVIFAYIFSEKLHASGFMAVFVAGMVMGNKASLKLALHKPLTEKDEHFAFTTAFLMRLFIFVLLGSQVNFDNLTKDLSSSILLVGVFMFLIRPITVFICTSLDPVIKWTWQEKLFMCWTRETGVIPAALSGLLIGLKVPMAEEIAAVTFITILSTILIQATTTPWLAKKLNLLAEDKKSANQSDIS